MSNQDEEVDDLGYKESNRRSINDDPFGSSNETKSKDGKKGAKKKKKVKDGRVSKLDLSVQSRMNEQDDVQNSSTYSQEESDSSKTVLITVNLVMGEAVKQITFLMNNCKRIEDLIEKSIAMFNEEFQKESVLFKLITDENKFAVMPSKKTGFPKSDMPCFDSSTTIFESNCLHFTLVWKDKPGDFQIYFLKIEVKEKNACKDCIIF